MYNNADKHLTFDALVIADLDMDVLARSAFMIDNDISVSPAKRVLIQGSKVILYRTQSRTISFA